MAAGPTRVDVMVAALREAGVAAEIRGEVVWIDKRVDPSVVFQAWQLSWAWAGKPGRTFRGFTNYHWSTVRDDLRAQAWWLRWLREYGYEAEAARLEAS